MFIYRSNLEYGILPSPSLENDLKSRSCECLLQAGFYSKMTIVRKPFQKTQAIFFSAIHLPIKWTDFLKIPVHQGKSTWHRSHVLVLYKPCTNLPFGGCAIYFYPQVPPRNLQLVQFACRSLRNPHMSQA